MTNNRPSTDSYLTVFPFFIPIGLFTIYILQASGDIPTMMNEDSWRRCTLWNHNVHYNNVTMSIMASQTAGIFSVCLDKHQKNTKPRVCKGNRSMNDEFPSQWANNGKTAFIWYHYQIGTMNYYPLFRVRSWNGMRCMSLYIHKSNLSSVHVILVLPHADKHKYI